MSWVFFFCHLQALPQDSNISKTSIELACTGVWTRNEVNQKNLQTLSMHMKSMRKLNQGYMQSMCTMFTISTLSVCFHITKSSAFFKICSSVFEAQHINFESTDANKMELPPCALKLCHWVQ